MTSVPAIEIEQPIAASRGLIWGACSTVAGLMRWQADDVSGEVREGGQVVLRYPAFGAELKLQVAKIVPEERLVLRMGESVVEFQVRDGAVVLRHEGIDAAADPEGLASSWRLSLAQLAHSLEQHPEQPRTVCWLARPVRGNASLIHACFTEGACLERWLGKGEIGAAGNRYAITSTDSLHLEGTVRVNVPGHDVALTCDNLQGSMLILRTLPGANAESGRRVALAWSLWGEHDTAWILPTLDAFESAIDDLQTFLSRMGND